MWASGVAAIVLLLGVSTGSELEESTPYVAPNTEGLHWAETFDGDVWTRWQSSSKEKYEGRFQVDKRRKEGLVGDLGLAVPDKAKHYGAAATFTPIKGQKDVPFVVQFEVRFQDGLSCGGSYIKLFDSEGMEASDFDNDTPYIIMFGPDQCGNTNKVHFILRHRNPKSGTWEEKHCKSPPNVPADKNTHLYTLIIKPDNSFEIQIDGEQKASGDLLTSMEPPINPPKEIDDPEDSKPKDWVEDAKIDDPTSSKPDDWDEDEPPRITDPKATMPSGWNEDASYKIHDPAAKRPDDWDDEEDGEWEPPTIDNPECKVGCGKWSPPTISNPKYKGKWYAPKIDNPEYKGVWKPHQIPNPNYFEDETPYMLPPVSAVGIDIWTMADGIIFDNIVVATDPAKAKAFAEQSFKLRQEIEKLQAPKTGTPITRVFDFVSENLIAFAVTLVAIVIASIYFCCIRTAAPPPPPKKTNGARESKKDDAKKEGEKDEKENVDDNNGEGKKEEDKDEKEECTEDKKDD